MSCTENEGKIRFIKTKAEKSLKTYLCHLPERCWWTSHHLHPPGPPWPESPFLPLTFLCVLSRLTHSSVFQLSRICFLPLYVFKRRSCFSSFRLSVVISHTPVQTRSHLLPESSHCRSSLPYLTGGSGYSAVMGIGRHSNQGTKTFDQAPPLPLKHRKNYQGSKFEYRSTHVKGSHKCGAHSGGDAHTLSHTTCNLSAVYKGM